MLTVTQKANLLERVQARYKQVTLEQHQLRQARQLMDSFGFFISSTPEGLVNRTEAVAEHLDEMIIGTEMEQVDLEHVMQWGETNEDELIEWAELAGHE